MTAGLLATKLNWECVASHWSNNSNNFIHVYDSNKVSLINKYYQIAPEERDRERGGREKGSIGMGALVGYREVEGIKLG